MLSIAAQPIDVPRNVTKLSDVTAFALDEAGLRNALEAHHIECYGWALSCCKRRGDEAENVLQLVYLKVLSGKAVFNGKSSFKTWLFAVIRKTAAHERRLEMFRRLRLSQIPRTPDENPSGEPHGV